MFWGDRYGKVVDPFGHHWGIATHVEDVSEEEMERRAAEWMAQMSAKTKASAAGQS
jgi:PhnB protein